MEKEILECVLKRNCKDLTTEKVISIEIVPAVGKYVNYLSTINRFNLKVILGNGRTAKKSLIIKTSPNEEKVVAFINKMSLFKNEIKMYGMLKEIEYLMEELHDYDDVLWCQMIYHIPYNCIVMEDLKAKGFYMLGREDFLDLEHSMLASHALGRYHGMCKALEERGIFSPQEFKSWYIFDDEFHNFTYWGIVSLLEGIKKLWGPSWTPIVDKIRITKESLSLRLKKFDEVDETKFNLLNHGDCHQHNILFKYDCDKRPIGIRFVDFQLVHYGSPALDLTYFMYLAIHPSVRRVNFDLLMNTYHDSLLNTLDKFHYNGNKPNIDEIASDMEKYCFIGMILFLSRHPKLFMTEEMRKNYDKVKVAATDGKEGYPDELFNPDLLLDNIGPDLKTFVDLFF